MSDAPLAMVGGDRSIATTATLEDTRLTEHDIRNHELVRARRALAFLKLRIGDGGGGPRARPPPAPRGAAPPPTAVLVSAPNAPAVPVTRWPREPARYSAK